MENVHGAPWEITSSIVAAANRHHVQNCQLPSLSKHSLKTRLTRAFAKYEIDLTPFDYSLKRILIRSVCSQRRHTVVVDSGSEAGSYLKLIDVVYHSTLGLRVRRHLQGAGYMASVLIMIKQVASFANALVKLFF